MSYRSTPSFEQQPRLFEYQRAIFKLHMLAKFDKERIISFSHLIEAREKEVAQQRARNEDVRSGIVGAVFIAYERESMAAVRKDLEKI